MEKGYGEILQIIQKASLISLLDATHCQKANPIYSQLFSASKQTAGQCWMKIISRVKFLTGKAWLSEVIDLRKENFLSESG